MTKQFFYHQRKRPNSNSFKLLLPLVSPTFPIFSANQHCPCIIVAWKWHGNFSVLGRLCRSISPASNCCLLLCLLHPNEEWGVQEKVAASIGHGSPCFAQPPGFDDAVGNEDKPVHLLSVNTSGNTEASFSVIINLFLDLNDKRQIPVWLSSKVSLWIMP